jgi:uncharacterized protein (DUF1501 family)
MTSHDNHDSRLAADLNTMNAAHDGCPEAKLLLSRRSLLGITTALFSSAILPDFAKAGTSPDARFLVVVLRGGMDGIGMLVPKLDPLYPSLRRNLALDFASTLSLGSDFALHPALARVHQMFLDGDAAFVPAAGIPVRNRSHFECQDNLENGLQANTPQATGWLNRLFGVLPAGDPIRTQRALGIGTAPLILRGPEPVLGWSNTWFEPSRPANVARIKAAYATDRSLLTSLTNGLAADQLARASGAGADNISELRKGFIGAARLMRNEKGPHVAVLSVGGWDTHSQEGGLTGQFADRLKDLDQALGDFRAEIGPLWSRTVAICCTEFGRTVKTNGDSGTDHGIATASILVGGAVKSGIIGDWPGLAPNNLEDGDLRVRVDLRSVFKGILRDHLGVPANLLETTVFPGSLKAAPINDLVDTPAPQLRLSALAPPPPPPPELSPIARYRQQFGLAM